MRLWPLPAVKMQERWVALAMAALVIGIEFAQVAINVRISYFNRDWFNAIQSKDAAAFWSLLFSVFCLWAAVYVASAIIQYVIQSFLRIRWRAWMTRHYVERWLGNDTHYRMGFSGAQADNPDQRIADDIDQFTQTTQSLAINVISTVSNLISFSVILWNISSAFTVPGTDWHVPGFLVWGALIYSGLVTWITIASAGSSPGSTSSSSAARRISASRSPACASMASRWRCSTAPGRKRSRSVSASPR